MTDETQEDYNDWTVDELKEELRSRELAVSGSKDELVARLQEADANPDDESADEESADGEESDEEENLVPPEVPSEFLSAEEKEANAVEQETQAQMVMREGEPDKDKPQ